MTLITKPDFTYVWASGGAVVAPNDAKKQQGWVAEAPPFQYDNWLQNRQDQMLAHINQRGIPAWDGLTNYEAGGLSYVQGSDGKVYKSVAASGPSSVVSNPTTDGTDTYWTIAFADVGAFLTQTAGDARYAQRNNNLSDLTNVAAARTNLALGTAATATLTTSATDPTAGRVLKVGDFGLGTTAVHYGGDLNLLGHVTGFYRTVSGATNFPNGCIDSCFVHIGSGDTYSQIIVGYGSSRMFTRSGTGVVPNINWQLWREVALTDSPAFTGSPTAPTAAAGTNTTQLANTAFVKATVDNSAIGVGQTWQDVTSSRTPGVIYTNTSGRPIYIKVTHAEGQSYNRLYVNGLLVDESWLNTNLGMTITASAIVPSGSTYQLFASGEAGEYARWMELR